MNKEEIIHDMELNASPKDVYQTLISSEKHSKLTGAPAQFDAKGNREFSTFNGAITGKITNLIENEKIELDWRTEAFPEGYYTKVVFSLEKSGRGTKLKFKHKGVPDEAVDMITEGWEKNYWINLEKQFS